LSKKSIDALKQANKIKDKLEKAKEGAEKAAIYADIQQCKNLGLDTGNCRANGCNHNMFVASECGLNNISLFELTGKLWGKQCYKPQNGEYLVSMMFLPSRAENKVKGVKGGKKAYPFCPWVTPGDTDVYVDKKASYWIDCQHCGAGHAYHKQCPQGSKSPRFPGWKDPKEAEKHLAVDKVESWWYGDESSLKCKLNGALVDTSPSAKKVIEQNKEASGASGNALLPPWLFVGVLMAKLAF